MCCRCGCFLFLNGAAVTWPARLAASTSDTTPWMTIFMHFSPHGRWRQADMGGTLACPAAVYWNIHAPAGLIGWQLRAVRRVNA